MITTVALADMLEASINHRGNNSSEAARIFRDNGCIYHDERSVKIIHSCLNIFQGKMQRYNGRPKVTTVSSSFGRAVGRVFDVELSTAHAIKLGDFIASILIKADILKLTKESYMTETDISLWINDKKVRRSIRSTPYLLEPGTDYVEIEVSNNTRDGIRGDEYPEWRKGCRISNGVKQRLVKSDVEINSEHDREVFMNSIKVLEKTRWSIDEQVAEVSEQLKDLIVDSRITVKDKDGNDVKFASTDVNRVKQNKHLKYVNLYRADGNLFEPQHGNSRAVKVLEKSIQRHTNRRNNASKEFTKNKHQKVIDDLKVEFNIVSRWWADKRACLRAASKAHRNNIILQTINDWKHKGFFLAYYADYRGRKYTTETYLTFQGNDLAKGHLTFSRKLKMTQSGIDWTFIHTANSFNQSYSINELSGLELECDYAKDLKENGLTDISVDKMSKTDRYNWTADNLDFIAKIALDPIKYKDEWINCEKPWTFLQMCFEIMGILGAIATDDKYFSDTVISIDGSNNGLQHLSAATRDESAGALVGLTEQEFPLDFYVKVMQKIESKNKGTPLGDFLDSLPMKKKRKGIAKRGTMTRHYDAGVRCIADIIEQDCYDSNIDITKVEAKKLAKDLVESYNDLCTKPMETKKFLQKIVEYKMNEEGVTGVSWTSPAGFPVLTKKPVKYTRFIKGMLGGKRINHVYLEAIDKQATSEHLSAIGANWVHSMDASHMDLTVDLLDQRDILDFAPVHDSFGVHACNVDDLVKCTKQSFIGMYSGDVLDDFQKQVVYLDEVEGLVKPSMGDLNLNSVKDSKYFFV